MGRGPGIKRKLQDEILKRRGLERTSKGGLGPPQPPPPDDSKTLAMRLIEQQHGRPLEELLLDGSLEEVGATLGIDQSTVSKWRLRLGLRERKDQMCD